MSWRSKGGSPEVPDLCTRECFAGRAVAAGTICKYAHCVALLTPIRRGGVRVGVWLLLDDDGYGTHAGLTMNDLSIAQPTLPFWGPDTYFRHSVYDSSSNFCSSLFTPCCDVRVLSKTCSLPQRTGSASLQVTLGYLPVQPSRIAIDKDV